MKFVILIFAVLLSACSDTSLHEAARENDVEKLLLLVEEGYSVDSEYLLWGTPLHSAASHGSLDAAKALINVGSDVNKRAGGNEYTPLHRAAIDFRMDMIELLLSHGADPTILDNDDRTAEDIIRYFGSINYTEQQTNGALETYQTLINQYTNNENH